MRDEAIEGGSSADGGRTETEDVRRPTTVPFNATLYICTSPYAFSPLSTRRERHKGEQKIHINN